MAHRPEKAALMEERYQPGRERPAPVAAVGAPLASDSFRERWRNRVPVIGVVALAVIVPVISVFGVRPVPAAPSGAEPIVVRYVADTPPCEHPIEP